jgi:hypothetical protein
MSWINGNGFVPNDGLNGSSAAWLAAGEFPSGAFPPGSPANAGYGASGIDRVRPAWFGGANDPAQALGYGFAGDPSGGGTGMFAQFASALQQLIGRFGNALQGGGGSGTAGGGSRFQNVSLASTGDPHLSVSGTAWTGDGTTANVDAHFDSMTSHADLFSTREFGGLDVSTTVTTPGANGITQNASATATMDGGFDAVTMTNAGTISVTSGGVAVDVPPGQSVTLAGGETVSEAANGSVSIAEQSFGKSLVTTFAKNGSGGVDVTASGHDVTLGGDLISGANPAAQPAPAWRRTQGYV